MFGCLYLGFAFWNIFYERLQWFYIVNVFYSIFEFVLIQPENIIGFCNCLMTCQFLPKFKKHLSEGDIDECFDLRYYTKNVDRIFRRVFGR